MIQFKTVIKKFDEQGEKTGWTYITISAHLAEKLNPGFKKSFRIKGKLDNYSIKQMALLPMGGGDFILPLKKEIQKKIGKRRGHSLNVQLEIDHTPLNQSSELMDCLNEEPVALQFFNKLPGSHQNYYTKWIESAKTDQTRANRIAMAVNGFLRGMGYPQMMRAAKADRNQKLKS